MSHIYGASSSHVTDEEQCLFTCPHCHVLLIVCPRCQRSVSSLELFHGDIVVECLNCLDNLPHRFHSCWHCHWNFSKAIEMIDSTTPLHEGFLYKLGRKSHTWKRRYFVLVENLLYYYKEKEDTKPLGFFFLQDCFIDSMDQIQGVSSCLLPKKDDLEQRDAIKSMNAKTKQVSNKSKWLDVCRERISTTLQLPLCVNNHFNALCSSFLSRNVKNKCRFSITHESGQIPSREFYTDTLEERGVWLKALLLAMHQDLVTDFYDIHQVVGQGKFSVVHCAYPLDTSRSHEPVAVKVIERKKMTNQQHQLLRSEISILRLLRHPHVIQFRQIFTSPTHIYIVMEYVKGGELSELFQKKRFLHESHVNRIIYQLLSTIAYLHKCGIIHRDIKPENILLTDTSNDDADIKITDFGLSCICGPSEYVTQPCGTLAYVAPEILNLQGYNHKVDVWSVGIIMYLLLRGRLPFPIHQIKPYAQHDSLKVKDNKSQKHLKTHNTANFTQLFSLKFSGPIWDNVSSSAKDLLRKLLQPDPRKRISAQDALEHIWIKNPTAVITESIVENTFFPPSS
jgi:serine/threonine protein kinase